MRTILALMLLALVLLTSCASTFNLSWTMPVTDNEGTCTARILSPTPPGSGLRAAFTITQGTTTVVDTVNGTTGQVFLNRLFTVPKSGIWSVNLRTLDLFGNIATCDTTVSVVARGKPGVVADLKQP